VIKAENLRRSFSKIEFDLAGSRTASFGVAGYTPGDSKESLIQRADQALYRAKDNGRNRTEKIE